MNVDKLSDAITNIDPSFIEEASYENNTDGLNCIMFKRKVARTKKIRMISTFVPVAACVLLVLGVRLAGPLVNVEQSSPQPAASTIMEYEASAEEPSVGEASVVYEEVSDDEYREEYEGDKESSSITENVPGSEAGLNTVFEEGILSISCDNEEIFNSLFSNGTEGFELALFCASKTGWMEMELDSRDESRIYVISSEEEMCIEVDLKDIEFEPNIYRLLIGSEEILFDVE